MTIERDGSKLAERAGGAAENESPKLRRHKRVGVAGCLLGFAIGLFGLLLGRLGQLWIAFDVFAQFTPQFLFMTAAFALGLLVPRAKVLVSVLLVVGMVAAYGLWPLLAPGEFTAARASPAALRTLKVATFNTWMENSSPAAVIKELERMDADVVTLIEFGPDKLQLLPQLKSRYPYQADCMADSQCHFAILSKYPLGGVTHQAVWEGAPYLHAILGGDFNGLNVVAVHTTRFPHSRAQFRQIKALSKLLQETAGPKLVMGDFNATPFSRITEVIPAETNMQRLTNLPSWPATFGLPQLAIDHVFVSEGIVEVEAPRLGDAAGSDHFPVYMQIAVPPALLAK